MVAANRAGDDVAMTTEQPNPSVDPSAGAAARPAPARPLRRRATDRVIGGVAGGLGDYLNIDPILLRVAFAGLMIFGGSGVVLYVLGWILIPTAGESDSIAQTWLRHFGQRTGRLGALILVVAAVIFFSSGINPGRDTFYIPSEIFWAFAIAVIGVLLLLRHDGAAEGSHAPAGPGADAGWATAPDGATMPFSSPTMPVAGQYAAPQYAAPQYAAPLKARPRDRSPLAWYTLGAALIALGLLAVADNMAGVRVLPGQYAGAGVLALGLGLLVAAWWGRARVLILVGLLVLPMAGVAAFLTVPLEGGFADTDFQPATLSEVPAAYRLVAGQLWIDLTQLDAGGQPVTIDASVGVGEIYVIVPEDATVEVTSSVQGGRILVFGHRQVGTGLTEYVAAASPGSGLTLHLNLEAGLGQVQVDRSFAGGY